MGFDGAPDRPEPAADLADGLVEHASGPVPGDGAGASPEVLAVLFSRALRRAGLEPPLGSVVAFVQALGEVGVSRSAVYWAGRATLVHRPEDIEVYDLAFAAFWTGEARSVERELGGEEVLFAFDDDEADEDEEGPEGADDAEQGPDTPIVEVRWSDVELLRDKDFAACTVAELEEARRLMADLRFAGSPRRSRRWRRAHSRSRRLDLRRTVRHALRAQGEAVRRSHLEHGDRPRRLVLLADVSGSMEAYSRALLRFVHAAVVGRTKVEAFAIGTRLTRLTRELQTHDPDAALDRAARAVQDWSGGTRLGEALAEFNDTWGMRGMARGAIVVVLSDGWDRGDPALLAAQMERLHRVAHRVVWVNPLKASEGYAPLAQGMAAALPFVDHFVEGHSLASLEQLAEVIAA